VVSRRAALIGLGTVGVVAVAAGVSYELVEAEVVPGRSVVDRALGRCDAPPVPPALLAAPGPTVTGDFRSARRRRQVSYTISYPPGYREGARLPVCLALHGYSSTGRDAATTADYPSLVAGLVAAGKAPFALIGPDGGDGYWHPHATAASLGSSGAVITDDPLGMLVDDLLPVLSGHGLDTDRLAVAGWSMGGYGALLCGLTWPGRFRAIVANSPAIFHSFEDARKVNPGAFDSAAEWQRYDVTARAKEFAGLPLHVTIGAADPFLRAVRHFGDRLPDPGVVRVSTGCHDGRFWTSVAPAMVQLISDALAR